jgi:hypothetical protein
MLWKYFQTNQKLWFNGGGMVINELHRSTRIFWDKNKGACGKRSNIILAKINVDNPSN